MSKLYGVAGASDHDFVGPYNSRKEAWEENEGEDYPLQTAEFIPVTVEELTSGLIDFDSISESLEIAADEIAGDASADWGNELPDSGTIEATEAGKECIRKMEEALTEYLKKEHPPDFYHAIDIRDHAAGEPPADE